MENVELCGASCRSDCGDDADDDRRNENRDDGAERNLNGVDESFRQRHGHGDSKRYADDHAKRRTEDRDDDGFPSHRTLELTTCHADGTQQTEFARALEDRQCHGVCNTQHGDCNCKDEQRIHDEQQLVQLVLLALLEFDTILHFGAGELLGNTFDRRTCGIGVDTLGDLRSDEEVERGSG